MNRVEIGREGERVARLYLESQGYLIIQANFYCRFGEVDLVISLGVQKDLLIFVEVKLLTKNNLYLSETISRKKLRNLQNTINYYLFENDLGDREITVVMLGISRKHQNYYTIEYAQNLEFSTKLYI